MQNFMNNGRGSNLGSDANAEQPRKSPTYLKFVEHASNQHPSQTESDSYDSTRPHGRPQKIYSRPGGMGMSNFPNSDMNVGLEPLAADHLYNHKLLIDHQVEKAAPDKELNVESSCDLDRANTENQPFEDQVFHNNHQMA